MIVHGTAKLKGGVNIKTKRVFANENGIEVLTGCNFSGNHPGSSDEIIPH